jgi:hypothetical protein
MTRKSSILRGNSPEPAMLSSRALCESEELTVRAGDPDGPMQLYSVFARGLRFILARRTACHSVEGMVLDVLGNVIAEIQGGRLIERGDLPRLVLTMARRSIERHNSGLGGKKREAEISPGIPLVKPKVNDETKQMMQHTTQSAQQALALLDPKQREILTRWYLRRQSDAQICAAMKLTETEVRNCKTQHRLSFGGVNRKPATVGYFTSNRSDVIAAHSWDGGSSHKN